jgi:hypothetical protein
VSEVEPFGIATIYRRPRQHCETAIRQSAAVEPAYQRRAGSLQFTGSNCGPSGTHSFLAQRRRKHQPDMRAGRLKVSTPSRPYHHSATTTHPRPWRNQQSWEVPSSSGLHGKFRLLTGYKIWLMFQKTSGICMCNIKDPDIFARTSRAPHSTLRQRALPAEHVVGSVMQCLSGSF